MPGEAIILAYLREKIASTRFPEEQKQLFEFILPPGGRSKRKQTVAFNQTIPNPAGFASMARSFR
jgi:hypothetical protein